MMKRILSFVLAAVLLVGLVPATVLTASAADMKTSNSGIAMIKNLEGFSAEAYQHGGKWYIGYGTEISSKDLYPTGITQASAEALLKSHLQEKKAGCVEYELNNFMAKNNLSLSQTKFDALASLSYNIGTAWLSDSSSVIRSYVLNGTGGQAFIRDLVSRNTHNPESEYFKGLVTRRLKEANLYLNGVYNSVGSLTYVVLKDDTSDVLDSTDSVFAFDSKSLPAMPAAPAGKEVNFLGWYTRSYNSDGALAKEEPVYSLSGMGGKTLWPKWSGESKYTVNAKDLLSTKVYQDTKDSNGDLTFPATITDTTKVMCNLMANSSFKVLKETVVDNIKWAFGEGKDTLGAYCKGWVALRDNDGVADNSSTKVIATGTVLKSGKIQLFEGASTESRQLLDSSSKPVTLAEGTLVKIVERKAGANSVTWAKIQYNQSAYAKKADNTTELVTFPFAWIRLDKNIKVTNESSTETNPYLGKFATVTNCAQLNVRNAAGMVGTTIINRIGSGTQVTIYDTKTVDGKVWARVKWGEANEGWVYMYYLNVSGVTNSGVTGGSGTASDVLLYTGVVISNTNLNVRKSPAVNGAWVTSLATGTKVNIYEVTTTAGHKWGRTEKGWICLDYVNLTQVQQPDSGSSGTGTTGAGTGVTMYDVNAYQEADNNSQVMFTLKKGESIAISEQVPQKTATGSKIWGKVTVNGTTGWVNMAYVEVQTVTVVPPADESGSNSGIDPVNGSAGVIANASIPVNVRIAAGVQNNKVASLAVGTAVTVYELTEVNGAQWARIKWNGNEGWVAKQYVNLTGGIGGTGSSNTANGTTPGQISLTGTVNSNINLNVRSGAGLGNPQIASLPKGTKVTVYEQVTADGMLWGKINVNGTSGWVCMSYISVEQTSSSGTGVMGTIARCFDSVNVRSAPGVGNAIVGKLKVGTRVEIYEQRLHSAQYWGRVAQGWICMEYVVTDGIVPEGPINTESTQETTISSDSNVNTNKELVYNIKGTTIGDRQYIYKDATDKSGISGTIDANQPITILALKGDGDKTWGKINDYNTPGWIDLDRVELTKNTGYINTDAQSVYAKPDTTSTVIQILSINTEVKYQKYAMRGETPYVGIILPGGVDVTGWIPMSKISNQRISVVTSVSETDVAGFASEGIAMTEVDVYEYFTSSAVVFKLKAQGKAHFNLDFTDANSCRADGGKIWVKVKAKLDDGGKEGWLDLSKLSFTASYTFTAGPVNARVNTSMDAAIMGRVSQGETITISALMCDASGNVWGKIASGNATHNNFWVRMDGTDRVSVYPTTILEDGKTGYGVVANETNVMSNTVPNKVEFVLAAGTRVTFDGTQYASGNVVIKATDAQGNVMIGYIPTSALASFGLKATVNADNPPIFGADLATAITPETPILANQAVTVTSYVSGYAYIGIGYISAGWITIVP